VFCRHERVTRLAAVARPAGLDHRRRQQLETDAAEPHREVLVGFPGPGVQTHRRVGLREQRREVRDVDELALEVLRAGGHPALGGVLVEPRADAWTASTTRECSQWTGRTEAVAWKTAFPAPKAAAANAGR
jgi:hypothetical protein